MRGPEPGYVATPRLFLSLAATLLEFDPQQQRRAPAPSSPLAGGAGGGGLAAQSGCTTPAALVGAGPALDALVTRIEASGIAIAGI